MGYNLHPVVQVLLYHQGIHYPTFLLTCFAKTVFEWADCQRQTSYNPYNTAEWLVYPVWKLVLKPCTYRKGHVPSGAGIMPEALCPAILQFVGCYITGTSEPRRFYFKWKLLVIKHREVFPAIDFYFYA